MKASSMAQAAIRAILLFTASRGVAAEAPPPEVLSAIAADLDGDGKPDQVVLLQGAEASAADLAITLAPRDGVAGSRPSTILKTNLVEGHIFSLATNAKGSLVVHAGCGGCSDDVETTLTIIHRGGRFLVAGFAFDWDMRASRGTCDIDLLTGNAVRSRGVGKPKPFHARFAPVPLAAWSNERFVKRCRAP